MNPFDPINIYSSCHRVLEALYKFRLISEETWAASASQLTWVGFASLRVHK